MARARFGWLHLTDLHQGMKDQGWLWPNLRAELYRDLAALHDTCGPWDVVFFTGDLTQRGSAKELKELDATLADLWAKLAALGSTPVLIAVPGNHDLVRPPKPGAAHRVLTSWQTHTAIHDELWNKQSEYRKALAEAFRPYQAWWRRRPALPQGWTLTEGILPGELALSIPCHDDRRIGVVGLNSAFLQLDGSDFQGRLHLHPQQFHGACGGDGAAWTASHDVCFLLTHHPPSWLDGDSREHLRAEIAPPGRFVAHLYGHMHEQAQYATAEGGAAVRRSWQGPSLFGLESIGNGKLQRAHGYTAGCIEFSAEHAELRLWPRSAVKTQAGPLRLGVDRTMTTREDGGTEPELLRVRARPRPETEPSRATTAPGVLQQPGRPYDEAWHVMQPEDEQAAIDNVLAGHSVAVCAPLQFGKTWFLQRVRACIQALDKELTIVFLDLNGVGRSSLDVLLHGMGEQIARAVGLGGRFHWPEHGTPQHRLIQVLEDDIRPHVGGRLLLCLDFPDDLWSLDDRDAFFGVLRSLAGQADPQRWSWLTLFMALSMAPSLYLQSVTQSPLNVPEIILGELSPAQITDLARRHGLAWGTPEVAELMAAVGGHPLMVRQVLHEAATARRSLMQILDGPGIGRHLTRLEDLLLMDAALCASLRKLVDGGKIEPLHRRRLEAAGVIRRDDKTGKYVLRFAVYERLLERVCPS